MQYFFVCAGVSSVFHARFGVLSGRMGFGPRATSVRRTIVRLPVGRLQFRLALLRCGRWHAVDLLLGSLLHPGGNIDVDGRDPGSYSAGQESHLPSLIDSRHHSFKNPTPNNISSHLEFESETACIITVQI